MPHCTLAVCAGSKRRVTRQSTSDGENSLAGALGSVVVGLWLAQLAPTATIAVAAPRAVGLPHLSSNVDLVGKVRHMMRHVD